MPKNLIFRRSIVPVATIKQVDYIFNLATDCSIERSRLVEWILPLLNGRLIHFINELTMAEASLVIDYLQKVKEQRQEQDET